MSEHKTAGQPPMAAAETAAAEIDALADPEVVRSFLATARDPAVALQAALIVDRRQPDDPQVLELRRRVYESPRISRLFGRQNADGSWGDRPDAAGRILSTLWPAKILSEIGVTTGHPGLPAALDFLEQHAIVAGGGGVSIDGRREGVLSCFTGILADTLLRAGRTHTAEAPLSWITTYQQVRHAGRDLRTYGTPDGEPSIWGAYLAKRYGGCLSSTTCLIGLVKCGLALTRARDLGLGGPPAGDVISAIGQLLAERELFRRGDGSVIPLGARADAVGDAAERWLLPAFPLSYQTDLLEVAALAAEAGVPLERMRPALSRIAGWRLPDGTWPMLRTCSGTTWYQPERRSTTRGSHWITLRVLALRLRLQQAAGVRR